VGKEILALLQRAWKEFGGGAGIGVEEETEEKTSKKVDVEGCSCFEKLCRAIINAEEAKGGTSSFSEQQSRICGISFTFSPKS
jgi:hypothetical protein